MGGGGGERLDQIIFHYKRGGSRKSQKDAITKKDNCLKTNTKIDKYTKTDRYTKKVRDRGRYGERLMRTQSQKMTDS